MCSRAQMSGEQDGELEGGRKNRTGIAADCGKLRRLQAMISAVSERGSRRWGQGTGRCLADRRQGVDVGTGWMWMWGLEGGMGGLLGGMRELEEGLGGLTGGIQGVMS